MTAAVPTQSQFIRHLKKSHKNLAGLMPYKKVYGEPFSVVQQMRCELCGDSLLQDHEKIRSHLRGKHDNLCVRSYYEGVVLKAQQKQQQQQQQKEEKAEDSGDSSHSSIWFKS